MFPYFVLVLSVALNGWLLWKLHERQIVKTISPKPKPINVIKTPEVFWEAPSTLIEPVESAVIQWREAA